MHRGCMPREHRFALPDLIAPMKNGPGTPGPFSFRTRAPAPGAMPGTPGGKRDVPLHHAPDAAHHVYVIRPYTNAPLKPNGDRLLYGNCPLVELAKLFSSGYSFSRLSAPSVNAQRSSL